MAIAFTRGDSLRTTRLITKPAVNPEKNSMKGLRGYITTGQDTSDGGLRAKGSSVGPHREGPIGKRGSSGSPRMDTSKFRGSSDKSYRATSTGAPGRVVSNKSSPNRSPSEKEGPKRGKPPHGFHQQSAGARESFSPSGMAHPGKMESLRGRAKTSWER